VKPEIKASRAIQKLIAQAAAAGRDLSQYQNRTKELVQEARTYKPDPMYAAEALLLCIQKPARFMFKNCKREECKEPFGTNYRAVGYCSDHCRARDLEKIGIQWDPTKRPEERWGGEPPLVIPPDAVKTLRRLLSVLHDDDDELPQQSKELEIVEVDLPQLDDQNKTILQQLPVQELPVNTQMESSVFGFSLNLPISHPHHE
jgi:hypothetical protein